MRRVRRFPEPPMTSGSRASTGGRRRFKGRIQAAVEERQLRGLRMNEQGPGSDPVGDRRGLEERVLYELRAKPAAPVGKVHPKAREDEYGNRVSAGTGSEPCGGMS